MCFKCLPNLLNIRFLDVIPGADPEILKKEALYVSHHGWLTKKFLFFRWFKKAKITLEAVSFNIFKLLPFLKRRQYILSPIKSYQFFQIYKRFYKKKEKSSYSSQWGKKLGNVGLCFIAGCFIKPFKIIINHFLLNRSLCSQHFFFISQAR